jgi:hypothetical protein
MAAQSSFSSITQAQLAAQQANLARQYAQTIQRPDLKWMVDGCAVDFDDFVSIIFPEDSPERTAFLLKYAR